MIKCESYAIMFYPISVARGQSLIFDSHMWFIVLSHFFHTYYNCYNILFENKITTYILIYFKTNDTYNSYFCVLLGIN